MKDYIAVAGTCWTLRLPSQDDEVWRAIYLLRSVVSLYFRAAVELAGESTAN